MRTALDTNVLSSLWSDEPTAGRLARILDASRKQGVVAICGAVFAEAMAHPKATEKFIGGFLMDTEIEIDFDLDKQVWTEAGRRYAQYAERRRSSTREQPRRILADFVIGAHAMLTSDRLVTLDQGRYARDFPELVLL